MDRQEQRPTPTEIIAALARTGFLLEQRAAQKFQDAGFVVITNDAFPDPDTGKSREIDIVASFHDSLDDAEVGVSTSVIMECKNYSSPLVLIGKNRRRWPGPGDSVRLSFDPFTLGFSDQEFTRGLTEIFRSRDVGSVPEEGFVGNQLVKLDRLKGDWRADNSSIYDSILYPLVKARQYQMDVIDSDERAKREHGLERWEFPTIIDYLPVVLTAGDVYTVEVRSDALPSVSQVKWAALKRVFNSRDLHTTLRADVVSFAHLDEYIEQVLASVHDTKSMLIDNSHLFNPEWLLGNLGEPAQKDDFDAWLRYYRNQQER